MNSRQFEELVDVHRHLLHPVIPFQAGKENLCLLDLTASNHELTDDLLNDIHFFTAYINTTIKNNDARYGIGGYGEHRTVYRFSRVFDSEKSDEEPRRLHLGTDIWGNPYTPVMAPLNGVVHSFAFNSQPGDYGATIILAHQLQGLTFHALYGHLSLNSIKNLREGASVKAGEIFAEFGVPAENGGWPPHLHFQIILDTGNQKGDYPGVCRYSQKETWLANSPDPDILLQMNQYIKK